VPLLRSVGPAGISVGRQNIKQPMPTQSLAFPRMCGSLATDYQACCSCEDAYPAALLSVDCLGDAEKSSSPQPQRSNSTCQKLGISFPGQL